MKIDALKEEGVDLSDFNKLKKIDFPTFTSVLTTF